MSAPPDSTETAAVLRPWPMFLNPSAISLPTSFYESAYRLSQNFQFFFPNYLVLTLAVFHLTLLTRPLSLLIFACIYTAWVSLFLGNDDILTVLDFDIDPTVVLVFLVALTAVSVFLTGVWLRLLVALVIGAMIVAFHGVFRAPEDSTEDSSPLQNVVDSPMGDNAST